MSRTQLLLLGAALCSSLGCGATRVQQSTLVPAATLPPPPRHDGTIDLYLEDSTVTFVSRPERAPDSNAGLWIARHNFQGELTLHANEYFALRFGALQSLSAGAVRATPTTIRNPGDDLRGAGFGATANVPLGQEQTRLFLVADFALLYLPSFVRTACGNCDRDDPYLAGHVDTRAVGRVAVALTLAHALSSDVRLFASGAVANHPTNREEFDSDTEAVHADVDFGPANVTVGLGAEIDVAWLSFVPYVQWPVTADPVRYGPIVGLGIRGTWRRR